MDDLISRQDAIDIMHEWLANVFGVNSTSSRIGVFRQLRELPSVTQNPKTGKWIKITPASYGFSGFRCSNCNELMYGKTNFCPNCGADMREGETG